MLDCCDLNLGMEEFLGKNEKISAGGDGCYYQNLCMKRFSDENEKIFMTIGDLLFDGSHSASKFLEKHRILRNRI